MTLRMPAALWVAVFCLTLTANATPASDEVQLFGRLNKEVVAVGEPLVLEVKTYALLESAERAREFGRAFDRITAAASPYFVLMRIEPGDARTELITGGRRVVRSSRRIVFRATAAGVLALPEVSFEWDGRRLAFEGRSVASYRTSDRFHRAARAVVPIFVERKDTRRHRSYHRTGSGFLIRDDALVTSFHVVAEAQDVHVLLPDGSRIHTKEVWSIDPIRDVAILRVDPARTRAAGVEPLVLAGGVSSQADANADVFFSYGWPGGVQRSTAGIVYRSARLGFDRMWVSSNGVRPGDSGGPLLNTEGEVVGVITLGTPDATGSDVLRENICIANDPRPAIAQMRLALGSISMKSVFQQRGFRERPYVQAFRLLAMISRQERFDEGLMDALSSFESAVDVRPSDPGLHFMRGILYRMLGTPDEANSSFAEVLEIFEDFFPASYMLGLDRLLRRDFEAAAGYFERTSRVEPYRHLAQFGLARSLMGLHRYDWASELLDQVLDFDPHFAPALYQQALCRMVLGDDRSVVLLTSRLADVSFRWHRRLEHVMANPALQPRVVAELPRAKLRSAGRLERSP